MKKSIIRIIGLAVLLAAAAIAGAENAAPERIVAPLSKPGQPAVIQANLMFGAIKFTGYEGKDIIVDAKPTAKTMDGRGTGWARMPRVADNLAVVPTRSPDVFLRSNRDSEDKEKERKDKAAGMKKVPLENSGLTVEEDNNRVSIEVESWRSGYDLDVKVPYNSSIKIEGANLGGITVEGVTGEIEIESANGGIKLGNISGTVVATSTNGDIDVVLNRIAAGKPMSFVTFHGDIDLTLPADAKASVRIKSNMGEVFSDFDIALKQAPPDTDNSPKREGGKYRVSLDRAIYGTINGGGPELKIENFSGNVYLRKKK